MDAFNGEAFEALGEWKFSHDADRTYVGVLKFSPTDGLELRVVDPTGRDGIQAMFGDESAAKKKVSASGRTHSHGDISLFDGFVRSKPMSSHGPAETVYYFNRGLLGIATEDANSQKFSAIFTTSELLRVWLDQRIVEFDPTSIGDSINVRHTKPQPIEIQLDGNKKLTVRWDRYGPALSLAQSSVEISSRPWIGIEFGDVRSVDRALTEIDSATRLVSLLSGFEFVPALLQLRLTDEGMPRNRGHSIYFLGTRQRAKERSRDLNPMDLIFSFPAIETQFTNLAMAWFKFQGDIPGCMSVFFSAEYSTYTNQRLFALTSVLEALHRYLTKRHRCDLRVRVTDSIDRLSILAPEVIGDKDAFAARIVECRNWEAHCNEKGARGSGSEQHRLASKLKAIIDALILTQLGVAIADVSSAMRKSREYWFYASIETWPWDLKE